MPKNSLLILGLMSGTSSDGIEAALVRVSSAPPNLNSKLLNHTSLPIPPPIRKKILQIAEGTPFPAAEISQLNFRLGHLFAEAALAACKKFRISPKRLDLIASHGQTIFHQGQPVPFLGEITSSTLQIADASIIANLTGVTTISDFRPADMAVGGQGAPLVPFADYLLYRHEKLGRVSLNLGGIANVTVIPARAKPQDVFAFDTGPANILLDALVSHFTRGRQRFDKNAALARRGHLNNALIYRLMKDPYLKLSSAEVHGPRTLRRALRQRPAQLCPQTRYSPRRTSLHRHLFHRRIRRGRPSPLRLSETQNFPTHRLRRRRPQSPPHVPTRRITAAHRSR